MKKLLFAAGGVALLAVLGAAAYGAVLVSRLNTPEFQRTLLEQARAAVGADVRVKKMDISLLSGVTLEGIAVQNPAPFPGDFLAADAFVLRYKLRPLLAGRVEVERLSLEKPVLALAMDARGAFNYEKLGGAGRAPATGAAGAPPSALPLKIVLSRLSVEDGSVVMTDATRARLVTVDDADFRSAFEVEGGVARGKGNATIATVNLADLLFLRDVSAPLEASKKAVKLGPIRSRLAGGEATGDVTVRLERGFRYVASLAVKDAKVKTLLQEARSAAAVSGTLRGKAAFEGTGGLATMKGQGEGRIAECRIENAKVLALLSSVLRVPELANPDFDECRAEFTQAGSRLRTPVVSLKGEAVQLTGRGTVNLDSYALDYDMSLALSSKLLAKVTARELRTAFKDRGDGFSTVDFRVYGTTTSPQTDLLARVGKAAATEAIKGQLGKLFGKKKN
jgi:hypothetical protein